MRVPLVSVVLPVRNGGADLPKAVGTILAQTFTELELIVVNDGSTDATGTFLDSLRDPRVRVVHQDNMGLAKSLNRSIALAQGRYVARQDHDDWALPTRIEKQVAFMEANPDCAVVGTRAEIWVGERPTDRVHDHPTDDAALRFELLFDSYFVHSSVMMRKSALNEVGGYTTDPERQPPEDYDLWSRLARCYKVANLPERLTIYREVPKSLSRERSEAFIRRVALVSAENLAHAVGDDEPNRHHRNIAALTHGTSARLTYPLDADAMCEVIWEAATRIHARSPGSDVLQRAATRVSSLRTLSFVYAHPAVATLKGIATSIPGFAMVRAAARKLRVWGR